MSQRFLLGVLFAAAVVASATAVSAQVATLPIHQYTAHTTQPARRQGDVVASGITWACQGQSCTTSGSWPRPGVAACHALAIEVGPIASYGRPGAMLNAVQLATCNAQVPAAPVVAQPRVIPGVRVPVTPQGPVLRPVTPAAGPVMLDVPQLVVVGGASVSITDRGGPPVAINVPELSFVGGAPVVRTDSGAPPVTIAVPELVIVGR